MQAIRFLAHFNGRQARRRNEGSCSPARVGPNAAIQLANALTELQGEASALGVFALAGEEALYRNPPGEMLDEARAAALFNALFSSLPDPAAGRVARHAGRLTADYILANRIPRLFRVLLPLLPSPLSSRLLLKAIERHAWTFAGSGRVTTSGGRPRKIDIQDNPLMMPNCPWHKGVFERLFEVLVSGQTEVVHVQDDEKQSHDSRFELWLS